MNILDNLARSGTGALGADTWAELDPGVKFLWIITLILFLHHCYSQFSHWEMSEDTNLRLINYQVWKKLRI